MRLFVNGLPAYVPGSSPTPPSSPSFNAQWLMRAIIFFTSLRAFDIQLQSTRRFTSCCTDIGTMKKLVGIEISTFSIVSLLLLQLRDTSKMIYLMSIVQGVTHLYIKGHRIGNSQFGFPVMFKSFVHVVQVLICVGQSNFFGCPLQQLISAKPHS